MTVQATGSDGSSVRRTRADVTVLGPWSLATSQTFWEEFTPSALPDQVPGSGLRTVFLVEADWSRAEAEVTQSGSTAHIGVSGTGDLDAAAAQVSRFLSLDVDARAWPDVAARDPVIADAQSRLPGLRPCGFHSPYEAAAWAVLSQRIRMTQARGLRDHLIRRHGTGGAFPAPQVLRSTELDLPGRKAEYLHAVAAAALEGRLDGQALRAAAPEDAMRAVQEIHGLGPFAAELVVLRGANAPDALPQHEHRLDALLLERYGPDSSPAAVARGWRPFRTWAAVHIRALHEYGAASETGGRRSAARTSD